MPLNPILETLLEGMKASGAPSIAELSPADGREMYRLMSQDATKENMAEIKDTSVDNIPIRIYRPSLDSTLPCLVYFHGGGWVIGDLETHDALCRSLANASNCVVIAADYRLAPEHPYPAPLDDCIKVSKWVVDNAKQLNISKIALGGCSAGGNLATSVCLKFRDAIDGGNYKNAISHQLLVYPATDAAMDTPSYSENAEGYLLTRATMTWFWDHYLGDQNKLDPYVSPLLATSVENLPSATILTAEFDPLRDEGEAYARRLEAAGINVYLKRYDGMVHDFAKMADALIDAREAISLIGSQLKSALND
ncbi:MAG: acetyl esterase [Candidatus Azotimanducaceae bacterium]|jgi:acetyl esterase